MKILYVWHAAVEKEYRRLFAEMAGKGHRVFVVTAAEWFESSKLQKYAYDPEIDKTFSIVALRTLFKNHVRSFFYINIFKVILTLMKFKPDVVYLKEEPFSASAFEWTVLTRIFCPAAKIVSETDENLYVRHPLLFRLFEKYTFKNLQAIAVVPAEGMDIYREKGFRGFIEKTHYFYNQDRFYPVEREKAFMQLPQLSEGGIKFGYVGRITEEKGMDTLVRSLELLKQEKFSVKIYLAGGGKAEYLELLKKQLSDSKLTGAVIFLGSLPIEKLIYFYNGIDALILPSRTTPWWKEQFGRVIVESMACGTPVIGSSSGEIPLVIHDERFIFREDDPNALASIIKDFVTGKYLRDELSGNLIHYARDNFSAPAAASNKLKIMGKVTKHDAV